MAEIDAPEYQSDNSDNEDNNAGNQNNKINAGKGQVSGGVGGSFRDFLLKEELLRAIQEAGFEKPSEVQNATINKAVGGRDILCQAQAGTGKTAVFVVSILNQLQKDAKESSCLILAPVRELATQIRDEFRRFSKFLPFKIECFYGGNNISQSIDTLKSQRPHIVVGCPGRILELINKGHLKLNNVKYFVVDECDRMLGDPKMRPDVQDIFIKTPRDKQTMMFSGTISTEIRDICVKYMDNPVEIIVEDQSQLVLNGLDQYQKEITEGQKIAEIKRLLDELDFSQVIVFVNKPDRADALAKELDKHGQKCQSIHARKTQDQRTNVTTEFKHTSNRVLIATDLFQRGMDFSKVNLVINFDAPKSREAYLHRVGRAGRQQTKGIAITFITSEEDKELIQQVQKDLRFEIAPLPETLRN